MSILTFDEKLEMIDHSPPSYEDYASVVELFRTIYHTKEDTAITMLSKKQVRLIYLSLMTTKAQLKEYDPKKGLNQ